MSDKIMSFEEFTGLPASEQNKPKEQSVSELIASFHESRAAMWKKYEAMDEASYRPTVSEETYATPKVDDQQYKGLIAALEVEALAAYLALHGIK